MSAELYEFCLRCHRKLKKDEAKRIGYGKICYEKSKTEKPRKTLFKPIEKSSNM